MRAKKAFFVASAMGLASLPLTSFAATTSTNTTVTAVINSSISIDSLTPTNVSVTLNPTGAGVVSSTSQTVAVSTNNATGFKLYLKDANTDLTLGDPTGPIAAHSAAWGSASALANNTWGYAIPGATGFDATYSAETDNGSSTSKWVGITSSDQELKNVATAGTNNTVVWYGVRATTATPPGSYADTVTYTATTN